MERSPGDSHATPYNAARSNLWSLAWFGSVRITKTITMFALTELILCLGHLLAWYPNARLPLSLTSTLRQGSGIHITSTCSLYETPTGRRRCKLLLSMNWVRAKDKGGEHLCTWLKPLFYIRNWGFAQSSPGNSAINYLQEKMMGVKASDDLRHTSCLFCVFGLQHRDSEHVI